MTPKKPVACTHCGKVFLRKNGGREKQCSLECRFWSKVDKKNNCWEWTAALFAKTGYGQFALTSKKPETAHRMSWMLTHGEIPNGLFVLHHCDNRLCCNPSHLFIGTHKDNMVDMSQKGRHVGSRGKRHSEAYRAERSSMVTAAWSLAKAQGSARPRAKHYERTN